MVSSAQQRKSPSSSSTWKPKKYITKRVSTGQRTPPPPHPRADSAGVVLVTHDGSHLVMVERGSGGLLGDFSAAMKPDSSPKDTAVQALEDATHLTLDILGGEAEALIGSTYLEAPRRPTRELFVVRLSAGMEVPDNLQTLDVASTPIWDYKDKLIEEMHYARGKSGSRRGLCGLQGLIQRVQQRFASSGAPMWTFPAHVQTADSAEQKQQQHDDDGDAWDDIGWLL